MAASLQTGVCMPLGTHLGVSRGSFRRKSFPKSFPVLPAKKQLPTARKLDQSSRDEHVENHFPSILRMTPCRKPGDVATCWIANDSLDRLGFLDCLAYWPQLVGAPT